VVRGGAALKSGKLWTLTSVTFFLALMPHHAKSQWMPELFGAEAAAGLATLHEAETLVCTFGPGHLTRWNSGNPASEEAMFGDDPTVYHSVDLAKGKAKTGGHAGTAPVSATFTSTGLHFTLVMPNGNVTMTTVYPVNKPETSEFIAVDSRHRLSPYPSSESLCRIFPQQYHGTCKIVSSH